MSASERSNLSTPEAAVREDGAAVPEARFSSQMLDLLLLYTNIEGNALSKQVRRRQLCAGSWSALLCHVLSSRSQVSIALALGRVQIVLIVIGLIGLIFLVVECQYSVGSACSSGFPLAQCAVVRFTVLSLRNDTLPRDAVYSSDVVAGGAGGKRERGKRQAH